MLGHLTEEEYFKIKPSDPVPAVFYGLPKVQNVQLTVKDNHYTLASPSTSIPLRPINSRMGSLTNIVFKYLADLLSPPRSDHKKRNRIFRRRIPVHFYSCRFSLRSHPKQAGLKLHLEGQDKPDQKPNCGADEVCTAQQLLFL